MKVQFGSATVSTNRVVAAWLKNSSPLTGIAVAYCLVACAPVSVVQLAPRITVVNKANMVVTELRYRPCDAPVEIWQSLAVTMPLRSGQAVVADFPLPCSDFSALYADGRTAGTQTGIKQQFPFRWDIY